MNIELNIVKWQNFGDFSHIAATDLLGNIHIFKDGEHSVTFFNCHSKLITDIEWIYYFNEGINEYSQV